MIYSEISGRMSNCAEGSGTCSLTLAHSVDSTNSSFPPFDFISLWSAAGLYIPRKVIKKSCAHILVSRSISHFLFPVERDNAILLFLKKIFRWEYTIDKILYKETNFLLGGRLYVCPFWTIDELLMYRSTKIDEDMINFANSTNGFVLVYSSIRDSLWK